MTDETERERIEGAAREAMIQDWSSELDDLCCGLDAADVPKAVAIIDPTSAPTFAHALMRRAGIRSRGPIAFCVEVGDIGVEVDGNLDPDLRAYVMHEGAMDAREAAASRNGGLVFVLAYWGCSMYRWGPHNLIEITYTLDA